MMISKNFLAASAVVAALAATPVAVAGGASATATPSHPKAGKSVELKISGMKPAEKIKAVEVITVSGQKRTLYPKQKSSSTGIVIVTVRAEVKGKHVWTFTGRTSHRTAVTHYVVT